MSTDDKTLLGTVDTRSLVDKVEMNLIEFFIKKKLQPGDVIPKEMELASTMGVSRTVIRESLNRLKTMGMIESKKHKGTIIKSPSITTILQKSMIPHILDISTLKNAFEMRLILEVGIADFVFQRKTENDIKELEELVEQEPEQSRDIMFDVDHEIRFHGKLYEMTRNESLITFQSILYPVFRYVYDSGLIDKPTDNVQYVSHKGLVKVLKEGTADEFRSAMREHLENHFQRILKVEQELEAQRRAEKE